MVQGGHWNNIVASCAAQQLCTQTGIGGATMNAQTTPLIDVQNVSKYFGSVIALKDISMSVRAGEVMCLLGDNRAGKSTLVKILPRAPPPSAARYLFAGNARHS